MNGVSDIGKKISDLEKLSQKQIILIDELEAHFRPDIKQFLAGETLPLFNGKPAITHYHFKRWLEKLAKAGFDEEIDFTK